MTVDETLELLRAITGATDGTLEMWNSHPHVGSFKRANGRVLLANGNCVLVGEHGTGIVLHASIRSYPEPMPLAIAVGVLLGATTATPAARLGAETLARLDPTNSASKMTAHTSTTAAVTAGPQKQMAAAVPMSQVIGMSLPARVSLRMPMAGTSNIADYFRNQSKQERALEACGKFLSHRKWPIKDRLGLYKPALRAFKVDTAPADALRSFAQVWDDLCGWQVFRPAGPGWLPEKMFETMKTELAGFACDGPLTLFNFRSSESPQDLLGRLEKFRGLKRINGFPVMAVSKFLHPYNPALFPVYDNAVIKDKVLPAFKAEFQQFCATANMPQMIGNTAGFYVSYMSWGGCLLGTAHSQFMQVFADWLGKQPSANLAGHDLDATRLQATAYEYTLIGAYADSLPR